MPGLITIKIDGKPVRVSWNGINPPTDAEVGFIENDYRRRRVAGKPAPQSPSAMQQGLLSQMWPAYQQRLANPMAQWRTPKQEATISKPALGRRPTFSQQLQAQMLSVAPKPKPSPRMVSLDDANSEFDRATRGRVSPENRQLVIQWLKAVASNSYSGHHVLPGDVKDAIAQAGKGVFQPFILDNDVVNWLPFHAEELVARMTQRHGVQTVPLISGGSISVDRARRLIAKKLRIPVEQVTTKRVVALARSRGYIPTPTGGEYELNPVDAALAASVPDDALGILLKGPAAFLGMTPRLLQDNLGQALGRPRGEMFSDEDLAANPWVQAGSLGFHVGKYVVAPELAATDVMAITQRSREVGIAKAGKELVSSIVEGLNFLEPGLSTTERAIRATTAALTLWGISHGARKAYLHGDRALAARELAGKLNVTDKEAWGILQALDHHVASGFRGRRPAPTGAGYSLEKGPDPEFDSKGRPSYLTAKERRSVRRKTNRAAALDRIIAENIGKNDDKSKELVRRAVEAKRKGEEGLARKEAPPPTEPEAFVDEPPPNAGASQFDKAPNPQAFPEGWLKAGAKLVVDGDRTRKSWGTKMIAKFGESVEQHLEELFDASFDRAAPALSAENDGLRKAARKAYEKLVGGEKKVVPKFDTASYDRRRAIQQSGDLEVAANRGFELRSADNESWILGRNKTHDGWIREQSSIPVETRWQTRRLFQQHVGDFLKRGYSVKHALADAAANQNVSTDVARQVVFKLIDIEAGLNSTGKGGLNAARVLKLLRGGPYSSGRTSKLADMIDAYLLEPTRGFMGHKRAGGSPLPVDVHIATDVGGLITPEILRKITNPEHGWANGTLNGLPIRSAKITGKTLRGGKIVPSEATFVLETPDGGTKTHVVKADFFGSLTPTQYEKIALKAASWVDALNSAKHMGGGWTADQLQSSGWMAMLKRRREALQTPEWTWNRVTSKLSHELNATDGSLLSQHYPEFSYVPTDVQASITYDVLSKTAKDLEAIIGGSLRVQLVERSWSLQNGKEAPTITVVATGSPMTREVLANSISFFTEQATQSMITFDGGERLGIIVRTVNGSPLPDDVMAGFLRDHGHLVNSACRIESGHFIGDLTPRQTGRIQDAFVQWVNKKNIRSEVRIVQHQQKTKKHDWKADPSGSLYRLGLDRAGGARLVRNVLDYYKQFCRTFEDSFEANAPGVLDPEGREARLTSLSDSFAKRQE